MNKNSETKNLILALFLSMIILLYWEYFIESPRQQHEVLVQKIKQKSEKLNAEKEVKFLNKPRDEVIAESPRVKIKSDTLNGSIELKGLCFNDLSFIKYREELDNNSPPVVLFSPLHSKNSYFAQIGWLSDDKNIMLPNEDTVWNSDKKELTPTNPLNLSWNNGNGLTFYVKIALDNKYLFTINSEVKDQNGKQIELQQYAFINRVHDVKNDTSNMIMQEGPIGVFDGILKEFPYKKLMEQKEQVFEASSGWLGISDKYWLAAIIPSKNAFSSKFSFYQSNSLEHYQAEYIASPSKENEIKFFAGAKEIALLDEYSAKYNIPLFDHAVDLGIFDFLTKPILKLLTYFHSVTNNFGISIILLTVVVKLLMFPLANKSFKSMNQMKKIQPKMTEIRERFKDDKLKLNQEMIELYKKEKINPASGCLPMFLQIPVFFALYKVLYVTIEMRHAPFFGWIHDLSAPDPTNLFTLFGLIAWNPPSILHLGIWPIIMSLTMFIQQQQSPPPADPAQAKVMKFLPVMFLFLFSSFAAGLVIYWSWSNILTILQQWYIKRKHP
ncbi:MAG: membrane protein insertase YidC [Pseudomonadota bacterium]